MRKPRSREGKKFTQYDNCKYLSWDSAVRSPEVGPVFTTIIYTLPNEIRHWSSGWVLSGWVGGCDYPWVPRTALSRVALCEHLYNE